MRRQHFEALRPVCPVCRSKPDPADSPLQIASVLREDRGHMVEGVLNCTHPQCLREYPIIDGIPLILSNIRAYLAANIQQVAGRDDLSPVIESILGDCCGQGHPFDTIRQQLSSYAWDHYADLDPHEQPGNPKPGSVLRVLDDALAAMNTQPTGPMIDIGCSVGRTAFALAEKFDQLVLGVDLHYPMLRLASGVLRAGVVRYPRKRNGVVYDRREFPASFKRAENVDFWACDAAALPFKDQTFAAATAMNVLDSVQSPLDLLQSLARVLVRDGKAAIACPYDWSSAATPIEGWIGGHSQRGPSGGASDAMLRSMLGSDNYGLENFRIVSEKDGLNWSVRLHDRSAVEYKVHLVVAQTGK